MTVTLETLRADFEAKKDRVRSVSEGRWVPIPTAAEFETARDAWLNEEVFSQLHGSGAGGIGPRKLFYPHLADWTADDWQNADGSRYEEPEAMIEAARRYIIARDFNVWEDGKWQMLYKLTYGGAQ